MTDQTPADLREQAKRLRDGLEMDFYGAPDAKDGHAGADALDAMARVLDLHRPVPIYEDADHCDCTDKDGHDVIEADGGTLLCATSPLDYSVCDACSQYESGAEEPTAWPCETVRIARGDTNERESHDG